jgi:hypothetical protein
LTVESEENMNKQEVIEEPEKPVLTKEEAEWIDKLTDFYSLPDALYYITRCGCCGYGHLFTFDFWGDTYELPVDNGTTYNETQRLKERLVNAVIYGYEVEKEKLYTVEIPNPNSDNHLVLRKNFDGKVCVSLLHSEYWRENESTRLTEAEIKECFNWAWQFAKEVQE